MKRVSILLLVLIVVEVIALAIRGGAAPLPEFPAVDLTLLSDSVTSDTLTNMQQSLDRRQPQDWKQLGEFYSSFGFFPQANQCFTIARQLAPHDDSLLLLQAISLDRLGEKREAIRAYRRAIQSEVPGAASFRIRIPCCLLAEGDHDAAMKELEAMGDDAEARLMRSRILIRSDRAREAQPLLDTLRNDFPDCLEPHSMSCWAAEELGDKEAAYAHQQRSLRTRAHLPRTSPVLPEDIQRRREHSYYVFQLRSLELEKRGRNEEAREACRQALRANWDEEMARSYALLEINLGQPQSAVTILEDAVSRVGASAPLLDALGEARYRMGNAAQAREAWLRACEMQATPFIHDKLARSFGEAGDGSKSEWHRGLADYELGKQAWLDNRLSEARRLFQSATQGASGHAPSWYYLGESLQLAGEDPAARDAFEQCLKIDPNHGRAWHSLQKWGGDKH